MKIKAIIAVILSLGLCFALPHSGFSQDDAYTVHVRKDFGYNMGSQIQGRFTVSLSGEEQGVAAVAFFVDDTLLSQFEAPPFRVQFQTEEFEPGIHQIYAEVHFEDGRSQITNSVQYNFLSQKEVNQQVKRVLIGIGSAILGAILLVFVIQSLVIKGSDKKSVQPGAPRSYGILGGTICPKCGRPFPRHIYGMNLVVGRLDRCDHCGKWSMTVRATPKALRMAEKAELDGLENEEGEIEIRENKKDILEDTKYFDKI